MTVDSVEGMDSSQGQPCEVTALERLQRDLLLRMDRVDRDERARLVALEPRHVETLGAMAAHLDVAPETLHLLPDESGSVA